MRPEQVAAEVLGCDAALLSATRIKGGLTNESWRIDAPETALVVRISTVDEYALQLDRANEAIVLNLVQRAGIGAEVLLCSPDRRLLVTRYLPAHTLTPDQLREADTVQKVAELLRSLHALSVPASVQTVNLLSVLQGYWATLDARQTVCDANLRTQASDYALESVQAGERCLCHHDVHHLNLMSDGSRLWLLDWEYAGLGDPLFDLASICCYHEYDPPMRERLLHAYNGSVSKSDLQRLERMCWLFDYIRALWVQVLQLDNGLIDS